MPKGFLPNSDGALLGWARHFSQGISISPGSLGLTGAQSAQFADLVDAFAASLALCDPGIRNKVSVQSKNDARSAMKDGARSLAMIIKGQPQVSDAQRVELGLAARLGSPGSIPPPALAPVVRVASVSGFVVSVRLLGIAGRRGRPSAVAGAIVLRFIGDAPPANASEWSFVDTTSATRIDIPFPSDTPPGTKVWICAAWVNPTLQRGPLCAAVGTHLQGGGVALSANLRDGLAKAA